jgi:cell division protease FtsH
MGRMPDEMNQSETDKASGRDAARRDMPRGPRGLRPVLLGLIVLAMLLFLIQYVTNAGRSVKKINFTEFKETYWDSAQQKYKGLSAARIYDDEIIADLADPPSPTADAKDADPAAPANSESPVTTEKPADAGEASNEKPAGEEPPARTTDDYFGFGPVRKSIRVHVPQGVIYDRQFFSELATIPKMDYIPSSNIWILLITQILPFLLLLAVFYFFFWRPLRSQGGPGGVLNFGRSRPRLISKEMTKVRFEDVAGAEEAKEEVAEVIEFLKNPEKFQQIGGRIPRGLLFVGPPGTGKTLLAKAIAGEADVPFYSISGSDFVEMFVGVGASRVRDLFRQAKENTPCIIFLDEVDAVGRRRGSGLGGGHDEREQTLNAILVEMDGFDTNDQVIVIAATNRPDVLDPALLRPGRFDREIVINLPDLKGRFEILKVHSRGVKMSDQVDLERIARGTPMFSGAELASLINEAAIGATMAGKKFIEQEDLEEARDKVRFGREKRSQVLDEHDRKVTAYHEAGHAIVTRLCPEVEPLHKVTIIPRGMALGATMMLPEKDRYTMTRKHLLGEIKVFFGGRIAEEIFFDDISTGASNDIERATEIARRMVCDFGMSPELGPIRYASKEQHVFLGGEIHNPREFSEATAEEIDKAVRRIISQCYADSEQLIRDNRDDLVLIAEALLKHETLTAEEVNTILSARSVDAVTKAVRNGRHAAGSNGTTESKKEDSSTKPESAHDA